MGGDGLLLVYWIGIESVQTVAHTIVQYIQIRVSYAIKNELSQLFRRI